MIHCRVQLPERDQPVVLRLALLLIGLLAGQIAFAQEILTGAAITEATGEILVQIGDGQPRPLNPGEALRPGMTLMTRPGASAVIVYPDGQIIALGAGSTLRNTNYKFDPRNPANSEINVNLVEGSMRLVAGEISLTNPQAVRVQAGVATLGIVPTQSGVTDASIAVQGGSVAVTMQGGRTRVSLPTGPSPEIGPGQGLYMGLGGAVRVGAAAQVLQSIVGLPQAAALQNQFLELQGFSQKLLLTSATASSIATALKSADLATLRQAGSQDPVMQQFLSQLSQLPPTATVLAQTLLPAFFSTGTPSTGGTGGGSGCRTASCS